MRWLVLPTACAAAVAFSTAVSGGSSFPAGLHAEPAIRYHNAASVATTTPIKHVVVLYQENIAFDHYFGTYPHAANLKGERKWVAKAGTPSVNGLTSTLLKHNPNLDNPIRLSPKHALTCDQDHLYTSEQKAEDNGKMDKFVQYTEGKATGTYEFCPSGIVMGYYDGNTVTALWNYAQHFTLLDNSFGSQFGPSTVGAQNLISGDTGTALCGPSGKVLNVSPCTSVPPAAGSSVGTTYNDADPYYDTCSDGGHPDPASDIAMSGPNIGTMLSAAHVTWGWFQGGFATCTEATPPMHDPVLGLKAEGITTAEDESIDYSPHHEPFQYYAATANPNHLPPTSTAMVGSQDQANHQYDLSSFWKAADSGHLPAVSFLKAPKYEDGHAGTSDPLDEQNYLVHTINQIEKLPQWSSTAIIISWDDSDGWYDHVFGPRVEGSNSSIDYSCGTTPVGDQPGRCGYGPRLPMLIISPFAKSNHVDAQLTDQTSIIRFIEDNWLGGKRVSKESFDNKAGSLLGAFNFKSKNAPLFLNPTTGAVTKTG